MKRIFVLIMALVIIKENEVNKNITVTILQQLSKFLKPCKIRVDRMGFILVKRDTVVAIPHVITFATDGIAFGRIDAESDRTDFAMYLPRTCAKNGREAVPLLNINLN